MNMLPTVPLAQILSRSQIPIVICPEKIYKQVTVRLFHKGIVLRGEQSGGAIATARQWRVRTGQVLLSRIDARNGAIGLVPPALEGAIVTSDFWAFDVNSELAEPRFLDLHFGTREFVEACQRASEGTTNRVRLQPNRFLGIRVPLPRLTEQRRIVARIEELSAKIGEARRLQQELLLMTPLLLERTAAQLFVADGQTTVADFACIQSGYAFKSDWFTSEGIRLVRNVNIGHGEIDWNQTARIPYCQKSEFSRFELSAGDVLISLDRPIISTGVKVAQVSDRDLPSLLLQRVGRICFKGNAVLSNYFLAWLRSPAFVSAIDPGRSNGIPHISPKDIERIAFSPPPLIEQRRIVAYLDDLRARVDALKKLQEDSAAELDALMPSILSKAFSGAL